MDGGAASGDGEAGGGPALELEGGEELRDPSAERDPRGGHDQQDRLLAEGAGDPERDRDLDDPDRELEPPEVEATLRQRSDGHVEDPLEEVEEADQRRERLERRVRVDERPDPHDAEEDAE